jgi:hypothetical protein
MVGHDTCTVPESGASPEAKRRKLWVLAHEIGLNRDDRLELASMILRRDILSWKHLEPEQLHRMLDALEGFQLISELKRQRV